MQRRRDAPHDLVADEPRKRELGADERADERATASAEERAGGGKRKWVGGGELGACTDVQNGYRGEDGSNAYANVGGNAGTGAITEAPCAAGTWNADGTNDCVAAVAGKCTSSNGSDCIGNNNTGATSEEFPAAGKCSSLDGIVCSGNVTGADDEVVCPAGTYNGGNQVMHTCTDAAAGYVASTDATKLQVNTGATVQTICGDGTFKAGAIDMLSAEQISCVIT